MGHTSRSMEDSRTLMSSQALSSIEGDLICGDLYQEVSGENNITLLSCDILVKNVYIFCPCPKNQPETKLKSYRLTVFAEISIDPCITMLLGYQWSCLCRSIIIKNELSKDKHKMFS